MGSERMITQRKQRWSRFLDLDPSVRHMVLMDLQDEFAGRPPCWPDKKNERIEWALRKYDMRFERMHILDDDKVPYLDVYTGTEIFAEAFGARVYRPEGAMPSARPFVRTPQEASKLKVPDMGSTPLMMLFDIADALRQRAGPEAILRIPDLQTPMDTVALIWDKSELFPAMLESPDAVEELGAKVRSLFITFMDEWFRRYGREFIAHYPDYYMPYGITVSEDEVGSVSTRLFEQLFLPELVELSTRYGQIGMHCCANARHHWNSFRKIPNLRLLNLGQPKEICQEAYREFATWTTQWHMWSGDGPAWTWPGQLSENVHAVLHAPAPDLDSAVELCKRIREQLHRAAGEACKSG